MSDPRRDTSRHIKAPTGSKITCKSWLSEAPMRMLMNNLHPDVAERPEDLVVYGGIGRAARDWACYDKIIEVLQRLEDDETLLVQSGKPVGVFQTHVDAPRVLITNSNLVPHWSSWEHFNDLDKMGLMMYGQMTAGSWIYIGSQGIVQGTYETFVAMAKKHLRGQLKVSGYSLAAWAAWEVLNLSRRQWRGLAASLSSVMRLASTLDYALDTSIKKLIA